MTKTTMLNTQIPRDFVKEIAKANDNKSINYFGNFDLNIGCSLTTEYS